MNELDQKILEMKRKGASYRKIAQAVGMTHEGVRKRLMGLESKDQMSTNYVDRRLTALIIEKEKVSTLPKPRISRDCGPFKDTVNQMSTQKTPSLELGGVSTPFTDAPATATDGNRWLSGDGCSGIDDLFGAIKEFLESHGVELYRQRCEPECYQVKHGQQIIRFYVQRKIGVDRAKEETEEKG